MIIRTVFAVSLLVLLGATLTVAQAPTTITDFFLPGSQPGESGFIELSTTCDCHDAYNTAVEPGFNWRGSMMAQAQRDPIFLASLAIAEQDAPGSGDLCLRCHTPKGWLEERSIPTNGSALTDADRDGVTCHACHKLVTPSPIGVNPYPTDPAYTSVTYPADQTYLGVITAIPSHSANGMYIVDEIDYRRGPYTDASPPHDKYYSPFFQEGALCGTCHDVSNPVFSRDTSGAYLPNNFNEAAPDFSPYEQFPVERTYSEWLMSEYNTPQGVYAPQFGGNKDTVHTCQDCHMRDVTGKGAQQGSVPTRTDLGLHDLTGGNAFMPHLVAQLFPGEVSAAAIDSGTQRATRMLQLAATMTTSVISAGADYQVTARVTNETGHKLPSGYPEGRRIWLNIQAYDSALNLVYESGAYDTATAELTHDSAVKIYEIKPGISDSIAAAVGQPVGPSFHFVLNNEIFKDNRIPPRGFTNTNYEMIQSPPVDYTYADGQYWDDTQYLLPPSSEIAFVTLYYQTTSKEYAEFLRDENSTDTTGDQFYDLWAANGKSAPVAMVADTVIMQSSLCPVAMTGDVNLTGEITSGDIIYMVNFVFKGGMEPLPCEASGDVNCDGAITAADIISLVNYVFKGGSVPCDVCTLIPGTWSCP
jgi:hypothetical protein